MEIVLNTQQDSHGKEKDAFFHRTKKRISYFFYKKNI